MFSRHRPVLASDEKGEHSAEKVHAGVVLPVGHLGAGHNPVIKFC